MQKEQKHEFSHQLIGMEIAFKLISKRSNISFSARSHDLRPDSEIFKVREILRDAKQPLHIDEILIRLGKSGDNKKKLSLAGSLASYVKQRRIFKKTLPNTFVLIELDENKEEKEKSENNE